MDYIPETTELKTPSGAHTVLIRSYLTGEDRRANRRMLIQISIDGKSGSVDALEQSENAMVEMIVKEIDGSKENIIENLMKFGLEDYDFVMEAVTEKIAVFSKKKDLKSETSTTPSLEELK